MLKTEMIERLRNVAKLLPSSADAIALREAANMIEHVDVTIKTFETIVKATFPQILPAAFTKDSEGNYFDLKLFVAYTIFKESRMRQYEPLAWLPDLIPK